MLNLKTLKHSLLCTLLFFTLAALLVGCGDSQPKKDANKIRVGIMLGAEQKLMEVVKEVAAEKYDLHIQLVTYVRFEDLNKALENNNIDANIFQTHFYAEYSEHKYGYHLSELGQTYIYPIGIYSKKVKNILHLRKGALIAIPNEPTNEARALFLLEKAGLIRMKSDRNAAATVNDIASNPRGFQIIRLPAREIAGMMPSVDIAVINISYAIPAGLKPSTDAIVLESGTPGYANMIAIREGDEKDPRMLALLEVLRSEEVQAAVEKIFYGQAIPAWP